MHCMTCAKLLAVRELRTSFGGSVECIDSMIECKSLPPTGIKVSVLPHRPHAARFPCIYHEYRRQLEYPGNREGGTKPEGRTNPAHG